MGKSQAIGRPATTGRPAIRWTWLEGSALAPAELDRMKAWLTENRIDITRVPLDSYFAHDQQADEFVVTYCERPMRVDPVTREVVTKRVRRRVLTSAPLPFHADLEGR